VDAAKPPRSAAAPRDPRGQLPRPRVRAAQTQRKLSEELDDIAGDVVLDLGTRNSFGASLSSTILGSEERDVSRGLLRSLARSRRSSGHNTPAVHTDAEDERVSRGEGSLMLAAGSTAGDPQTPQPRRRGAPPVPDLSRTPRREGQADADRDGCVRRITPPSPLLLAGNCHAPTGWGMSSKRRTAPTSPLTRRRRWQVHNV